MEQPATPHRPDDLTPPNSEPGTRNGDNSALNSELPAPSSAAAPEPEAPPPLTTAAWLKQNGLYLLVGAVLIAVIYKFLGTDGLVRIGTIVVGLGFVIFFHELGHFLAAKWCDVHVQTFSVGFGPAIPGCSFHYGETYYKLAIIPLGGYVQMVGEGFEHEEGDDYPRSFKNKSVSARMLIISAGVIMNLILAVLLYSFVFYVHGDHYQPAIIGKVDAGSPAWQNSLRSGMEIQQINGIDRPKWRDVLRTVALSGPGEKVNFVLADHGRSEGTRTVEVEPRAEENDKLPAVGIGAAQKLELPPPDQASVGVSLPDSAAAAARVLPLAPGELVVAATDPEHPGAMKPVAHDTAAGTWDYDDLSRRVRALKDKPLAVEVREPSLFPGWQALDVTRREADPAPGLRPGDRIVGVTDDRQAYQAAYDPFRVRELPPDPRAPGDPRQRDPFAYRNAARRLAGKPIVLQVERKNAAEGARADLVFVPPAYHYSFGMRMEMGKVAAVRKGSPAEKAGVQPGDKLTEVVMKPEMGGQTQKFTDIDPVRLPSQMAAFARECEGIKVTLTVSRNDRETKLPASKTLEAVEWDPAWASSEESPLNRFSPMSIPELGVAYWVDSVVAEVREGGPAAKAGLKPGDRIEEIRFRQPQDKDKPGEADWARWMPLKSRRGADDKVYDEWAHVAFILQAQESKDVRVKIFPSPSHGELTEQEKSDGIELTAVEESREGDPWPAAERGFYLLPDSRIDRPANLGEAAWMSLAATKGQVGDFYKQIRSLLTGRISASNVQGPLGIAETAFHVTGAGIYNFLLFLAFINIMLALFNFLPIPLLDGGHMAVLVYEKVRGRPPSESVRAVLTYAGLACILGLMVFAFWNDITRLIFGPV